MLQLRSKHPREMVITPKASTSLSVLFVSRFASSRTGSALLWTSTKLPTRRAISKYAPLVFMVFSVLFCMSRFASSKTGSALLWTSTKLPTRRAGGANGSSGSRRRPRNRERGSRPTLQVGGH